MLTDTTITSAEEMRRVLEARRVELGASKRELSEKAGFAHAAYWWWGAKGNAGSNKRGGVTLEAALCYAKVLGYRVELVPDTPLIGKLH
jgi:hypothetical protein